MIPMLASQNLRRGRHVDIRLDSIKQACFVRCPSTSGAPSSHYVCLASKYFAAKSHPVPCGLRGSSGSPWASELVFFIALQCGLARFPWLEAAGPQLHGELLSSDSFCLGGWSRISRQFEILGRWWCICVCFLLDRSGRAQRKTA